MRSKKLLPPIGSPDFKKLHYKEQLFILNLYYHDRTKYLDICGLPSDDVKYITDSVERVFSMAKAPRVANELPIAFVEDCWCAYLAFYDPKWYEEGFSPVDDLGLSHRRIFNIQLFNFPLLAFDTAGLRMLRWLRDQPKKTKDFTDIFFYFVKLRAAWEYFRTTDEDDAVDTWNSAIINLEEYLTVNDLNGGWPIIEDSQWIEQIEDEVLVMLYAKPKLLNGKWFVPLVPAELFHKDRFHVKGWDFLLPHEVH